jgi:hypothetical protein
MLDAVTSAVEQGLVAHIPGMKLSAKVFRTFNASQCLAEQL